MGLCDRSWGFVHVSCSLSFGDVHVDPAGETGVLSFTLRFVGPLEHFVGHNVEPFVEAFLQVYGLHGW